MTTYIKAILAINPTAECSLLDKNDLSTITWYDGTTPISAEDIQTKYDELIAIENKKVTDKTSGKAKLKSGDPLNDAEVEALFGV